MTTADAGIKEHLDSKLAAYKAAMEEKNGSRPPGLKKISPRGITP